MPTANDLGLVAGDKSAAVANAEKLNRAFAAGAAVQFDVPGEWFTMPLLIPEGRPVGLYGVSGSDLNPPWNQQATKLTLVVPGTLLTIGGKSKAAKEYAGAVSRSGVVRRIVLAAMPLAKSDSAIGLVVNSGLALSIDNVTASGLSVGFGTGGYGKTEGVSFSHCHAYQCGRGFELVGAVDDLDYSSASFHLEQCVTDGGDVGVWAKSCTGLRIHGGTYQAAKLAAFDFRTNTKATIESYSESIDGNGIKPVPTLRCRDWCEVSVRDSVVYGIDADDTSRVVVWNSVTGPDHLVKLGPSIYGRRHDCRPKAGTPLAPWGPPNFPSALGSRPSHSRDTKGDVWTDAAGNQWECTHSGVTWLATNDPQFNDRDAFSRWAPRSNPIVIPITDSLPWNSWSWPRRTLVPQEAFQMDRIELVDASGRKLAMVAGCMREAVRQNGYLLPANWIRSDSAVGVDADPIFDRGILDAARPLPYTLLIYGRSLV